MSQTSFNINSSFFLQQLDGTIIRLIKVLSVEHQISIEQAKEMAFNLIQDRIILALLNEDQRKELKKTYGEVISEIKKTNQPLFKQIYKTFKLMRLDK